MNKSIFIMLLMIISSMGVMANHDDISVKFDDSYRIDEDITLYYNMTLHQYDNMSIIVQSEDLINFTCISIYSPSAVTVEFNNKICKIDVNKPGKYYVIKNVFNEVEPNEYVGDFKVTNSHPSAWGIALLILGTVTLIVGLKIRPLLIISALFYIGAITSLLFTYQYLLSPIFIGLIIVIFVGLIIIIQQILFSMYN